MSTLAAPVSQPRVAPESSRAGERLYSVDAFRGFTMLCMFSMGFGLLFYRDHPLIGPIAYQFEHEAWEGMRFWDLIQPFFMFIVGVVMPVSFGRRWALGETWGQSLRHVLRRCALLILFGLLARSISAGRPVLDLINVLAQLSFTYFVAFLVLRQSWRAQGAVGMGLLAVHWAIYQFSSAPGVEGPWVRDANIGWYLDRAILGKNWGGSYATINILSSAANTIFGVMVGSLLLSGAPQRRKMLILAGSGLAAIAMGLALSPWIPIIKKIWTASFALYSTGFTVLALLLFYWVCDVRGWQKWAKVFVIVGSNSIFIYLFYEILGRWMRETGKVFTGWAMDAWGAPGQVLNVWLIIAFQVYVCYWLYRRKIFFKL
jgi:predicted acyltransferase